MTEERQHRKEEEHERELDAGPAEAPGARPVRPAGGGRRTPIESSPEERLMQIDSASAGPQEEDEEPRSAREASLDELDEIDERHGADARMEVRRREHSAD